MKRKKKNRLAAVELPVVLTGTALLFVKMQAYAAAQRGYFAIGGEIMIILLPIIYYAGKRVIRDFAADFAELYRNAPED